MSRERRREMVDREHPALSTVRQCALIGISRSSVYYRPRGHSQKDLAVMKLIDQQYLTTPFYGSRRVSAGLGGSRRMKVWLDREGYPANRKRVRRLMRTMGLQAIYRRPRTSKPALGHRVYPYLLGGMEITRPNQVWAADITYIPMARGFHYLVAIMDWYTRYVVAWNLSNTLDADFCVEALEEALGKGRPEVFNTDQGSQFTGASSPEPVHRRGLHRTPGAQQGQNQHGRERAVQRQHIRGAAVEDGEVRGSLPESLLQRTRGQGWPRRLLSFLQQPTAPPGLGLPDTG